MTANDIGNFARHGAKPLILFVNNDGYGVERVLEGYPYWVYNEPAQWKYPALPAALGCEAWYTPTVRTNGELDASMEKAASHGGASYIEIIMGKHD